MRFNLIVCQWILMIIGWCTWGEPISFIAFGAALAIGLFGVAKMLLEWLNPEWTEQDMTAVYESVNVGILKPSLIVFEQIAKAKQWDKGRFERWAKDRTWR